MNVYRRDGTNVFWMEHRAGGKRHSRTTGMRHRKEALRVAREWAERLDEHYLVNRTVIRMSVAMQAFLDHCAENGLARNTLRGYTYRLQNLLEYAGDIDLSKWINVILLDG